jgi:hypothetical protein
VPREPDGLERLPNGFRAQTLSFAFLVRGVPSGSKFADSLVLLVVVFLIVSLCFRNMSESLVHLVLLISLYDIVATQSAVVNQTLRYFDQQQLTWTWVMINYSSEDSRVEYRRDRSGILSANTNQLQIIREIFGTGIDAIQTEMVTGAVLPLPQCSKRRISVNYRVQYTVNNTLFGTWSGLHHKIVLANDADLPGEPRGLGFTFATGSSRNDPLRNYTWPNANVYVHNDTLVCTTVQVGCLLAENKNIAGGRLYGGDYSISFNAVIDTTTGLMSAESYTVAMSNQTFSTNVFNVTESQLTRALKTQAWNWLRPDLKPRVYLMAVSTSLTLSDLTIDVSDICDVALSSFAFPTTTIATAAPSQQSTTAVSTSQQIATTTAIDGSVPITSILSPPSNDSISSTAAAETLPFQTTQSATAVVEETILLPPMADEDATLIVVVIVVPLFILLTTIVVCYLCRRRLRRSAVCLHCFYLCPMLFACCSDKMGDEYGSSSSDFASRNSVGDSLVATSSPPPGNGVPQTEKQQTMHADATTNPTTAMSASASTNSLQYTSLPAERALYANTQARVSTHHGALPEKALPEKAADVRSSRSTATSHYVNADAIHLPGVRASNYDVLDRAEI